MSNHTPGPWRYVCDDNAWCVLGEDGTIAEIWHGSDLSTEADARLIAAAPQLLAALKAVEWIDDTVCVWCEICEGNPEIGHEPDCQLAAAIRAAEGEG